MALIDLESVSLDYHVYGTASRSFKRSLVDAITGGSLMSDNHILKVQALKDLSFTLIEGIRLGILGHNGAGKSTLLRVMAQIYNPSSGKIVVEGITNCLFDVMVGLDPNLSGYENIELRGMISGMSKKEIRKAIPHIAEFSGLGDFIRVPLRAYSAGMLLRLGFSVATHLESEILLIDEVVNVGDENFLAKAKARMKDLIHKSKIVVISTHDHRLIQELCNMVLYLEKGTIKFFGSCSEYFDNNWGIK